MCDTFSRDTHLLSKNFMLFMCSLIFIIYDNALLADLGDSIKCKKVFFTTKTILHRKK